MVPKKLSHIFRPSGRPWPRKNLLATKLSCLKNGERPFGGLHRQFQIRLPIRFQQTPTWKKSTLGIVAIYCIMRIDKMKTLPLVNWDPQPNATVSDMRYIPKDNSLLLHVTAGQESKVPVPLLAVHDANRKPEVRDLGASLARKLVATQANTHATACCTCSCLCTWSAAVSTLRREKVGTRLYMCRNLGFLQMPGLIMGALLHRPQRSFDAYGHILSLATSLFAF